LAVAGGLGSNDDNNTAIATTVTDSVGGTAIAGYFGDNNTNNTAIVTNGNNSIAQAGGGDGFLSGTPGSFNTNNTATADGADSIASAGAGSDNNDMLAANAGPGETDIVP